MGSNPANDANSVPVRVVAGPNNGPAAGAPFTTASTITPGAAFTASRAVALNVTTPGSITFTMAGGGTVVLPFPVSAAPVILPFSITELTGDGTVAGTFYSLS